MKISDVITAIESATTRQELNSIIVDICNAVGNRVLQFDLVQWGEMSTAIAKQRETFGREPIFTKL